MRRGGVRRIDIMKVDIEGAEFAMLSGSDAVFSGANRPAIILELNRSAQSRLGTNLDEVRAFLAAHGYKVHRVTDLSPFVPRDDDPSYFNVLACPEERLEVLLSAR
jgi:hypothetical protein